MKYIKCAWYISSEFKLKFQQEIRNRTSSEKKKWCKKRLFGLAIYPIPVAILIAHFWSYYRYKLKRKNEDYSNIKILTIQNKMEALKRRRCIPYVILKNVGSMVQFCGNIVCACSKHKYMLRTSYLHAEKADLSMCTVQAHRISEFCVCPYPEMWCINTVQVYEDLPKAITYHTQKNHQSQIIISRWLISR